MGKADTVTKAYMRKNEVFADAFNYLIYGGRMCIDSAQLQEVDITEIALPFGSQDEDGNRGEDALVFKTITNTPIDIPEGLEEIDVCKAVEEMILESTEKGIGIGEMRMLVKQVRKGRLTVEEAAEDAGMTVEKFKEVMENTPSQSV